MADGRLQVNVCKVAISELTRPNIAVTYVAPGTFICGKAHDGTIINIDGEPEGMGATFCRDDKGGYLKVYLARNIKARSKLGMYTVRVYFKP